MAGLAVPLSAPPPGVVIAPSRGFAAFDDRVVAAHPGLVVARAPEGAHESLLTHAARRLRTSGFDPIVVTRAPVVRELALQLGVRLHADARAMAEALAQAATGKRSVLLVALPDPATWDGAVL